MQSYHGTTILSVRRGERVALGGDGQVTLGQIVVKATARKVRRLHRDQVLAGFAGATADAFTLFERMLLDLRTTITRMLLRLQIGQAEELPRPMAPAKTSGASTGTK